MNTDSRVEKIWQDVEKMYIDSIRPEAHWLWKNHVQVVANNAAELSNTYGGRKDLVIIGSLLHDVADIELERDDPAFEARTRNIIEKIMKDNDYLIDDWIFVMDQVVDPHSCHLGNMPREIEGKILATADALAHLKTDFYRNIYNVFFTKKLSKEQYLDWVNKKLHRDFHDKIFFDEVRVAVEPYYNQLVKDFSVSR